MIASVFIAVMLLVPVVILLAVGVAVHCAKPWYARRAWPKEHPCLSGYRPRTA